MEDASSAHARSHRRADGGSPREPVVRVPAVADLHPPRLDADAAEVARAAAAAPDWAALADVARACVACPELASVRQHVVVGDVPVTGRPRFVLVGEAPGATEDETGRPFVGRSGALLDLLLGEAGLDRGQAAGLNIVKCRPPGHRTPEAPQGGPRRGRVARPPG